MAGLRQKLTDATSEALHLFDKLGAEVFVRRTESLYLWVALPGLDDSAAVATKMLEKKIVMAPGNIFRVDSTVPSRWSRFNVGAVTDPRFEAALRPMLAAQASK